MAEFSPITLSTNRQIIKIIAGIAVISVFIHKGCFKYHFIINFLRKFLLQHRRERDACFFHVSDDDAEDHEPLRRVHQLVEPGVLDEGLIRKQIAKLFDKVFRNVRLRSLRRRAFFVCRGFTVKNIIDRYAEIVCKFL